jgi:hypothetical protein
MTGDTFLGRQDFAKYVARIYPTITEESKVAFANWVHSTPTRIDRTKWWMDAYPQVRKLNHWGRLDLVDKIFADPIVRAELDRLALEDERAGVMTQRQRRQKLKTIADTTEHPTRGYTDHIKAMELDAKLDGTLGSANRSEAAASDTQRLPALNLFFLNTAEVKASSPMVTVGPNATSPDRADLAISQWTLDVPPTLPAPESPPPDTDDIL